MRHRVSSVTGRPASTSRCPCLPTCDGDQETGQLSLVHPLREAAVQPLQPGGVEPDLRRIGGHGQVREQFGHGHPRVVTPLTDEQRPRRAS